MKTRDKKSQSKRDLDQFQLIGEIFENDPISLVDKIEAFPKYVSRQTLAKFITKLDIFRKVLHVNGSIIECGCLHGAGTLTWAKLSSIFEPVNHTRKIISFDTFTGFPSTHEKDQPGTFHDLQTGGLAGSSYDSVLRGIDLYDKNRPLDHIPKIELVRGDFMDTAEEYLESNPHLVVALLYLDFDLYEPTRKALEVFVPRMPKGAVIVFDELNAKIFPGETQAVEEVMGLKNLRIERFEYDSYVSYAVLE